MLTGIRSWEEQDIGNEFLKFVVYRVLWEIHRISLSQSGSSVSIAICVIHDRDFTACREYESFKISFYWSLLWILINPLYNLWTRKRKYLKTKTKWHRLLWIVEWWHFLYFYSCVLLAVKQEAGGLSKRSSSSLKKLHTSCPFIKSGFYLLYDEKAICFHHSLIFEKLSPVDFMSKRIAVITGYGCSVLAWL